MGWNATFFIQTKTQFFPKGHLDIKPIRAVGDIYSHKYEICISIKTRPAGYINRGSDCAKQCLLAAKCTLIKECKPISERCIEPRGTRTIMAFLPH